MSSENPPVETLNTVCSSSQETHVVNSPVPPIISLTTSSNIPPVMTWNSYVGLNNSVGPQTMSVNTADGQPRSVPVQVVQRNYPTGYHTSAPVYGGSALEAPVTVSIVRQNVGNPSSIQQTLDIEPVRHTLELRQTIDETVRHTPPPHHAPVHPNVTMNDPSNMSTMIDTALHASVARPLTSMPMSSERLGTPIQCDTDAGIMTAGLHSSKLKDTHGAIAAMLSMPDATANNIAVVHNLPIQDAARHMPPQESLLQPQQSVYSVVTQAPVIETPTTHSLNSQHHQMHQDIVTLPLMAQPLQHLQQQAHGPTMATRSSKMNRGQAVVEAGGTVKRGRPLGSGRPPKKNAPRPVRQAASRGNSVPVDSNTCMTKDEHMDLAEVLKNVSMVPNPSKVSPRKLKRRAYSIRDKLKTVERVKSGEPRSKILRDMAIPDSTLRGWMKDEEKLRTFAFNVDIKKKKARTAKDTLLDSVLYSWYLQQKDRGMNVSGSMLKLKADELNKDINGENNFKASAGWLYRFQKRHNLGKQKDVEEDETITKPSASEGCRDEMLHFPYDQIAKSRETNSADENVVIFCQTLKELIAAGGYREEQIYTCDETGFFYKLLPDNNFLVPSDEPSCANSKRIRDRITILFCVNKTGHHKLKPLCVGKYRSPRGFQHVNVAKLPFWYKCSHNAWMTTSIFKDWFVTCFVPEVRQYLRYVKLEEKALLLLDECVAHPAGDVLSTPDRSIQVVFLPKDTTSVLQPLDLGIMANFKSNYRNELIQEVVTMDTEVKLFLRHLSLKRMMFYGEKAWTLIKPKTIERLWHRSFPGVFMAMSGDAEQLDSPGSPIADDATRSMAESERIFQEKLESSGIETSLNTIREWANLNENLPITDFGSNEGTPRLEQHEDAPEPMDQEPSEDEDENQTKIPSNTEAVKAFEIGLQWLESKNIDYITILQVQSILDYARYERRNELSQLNSC